jgi:putative phosphoribosyl transferase
LIAQVHAGRAQAYTAQTMAQTPAAALSGSLTLPQQPIGIAAFARGSGSNRFSPRNRAVAAFLNAI